MGIQIDGDKTLGWEEAQAAEHGTFPGIWTQRLHMNGNGIHITSDFNQKRLEVSDPHI